MLKDTIKNGAILSILFTTFLVLPVKAQVCTPVAPELVSWYSGDGNALDSRSRNNATLNNGATFSQGKVGQAFDFSGANDATAPDAPSLNFGLGSFSVETWVRADSFPTDYAAVVTKRNSNDTSRWQLFTGPAAFAGGAFRPWRVNLISGGTTINIQSDSDAQSGQWTHLAFVVDRANNVVKLYVNGVVQSSQSNLTSVGSFDSTLPLRIGSENPANPPDASYFDGQIDETSIYNRALSASEIASIFNAGTAGKCKPTATTAPSGQVAWFAGDGDARDIAGTNNGTLQNGAGFAIGKVGQGFRLDGNDDFIQIPAISPGSITVEGWINPQINGGTIYANRSPTQTEGFTVALTGSGGLNIILRPNSIGAITGATFQSDANTIQTGAFQHFAVTYDSSGTLVAYLNGLPVTLTQTNGPNSFNGSLVAGNSSFIGRKQNLEEGPSQVSSFNGQIDELSIYNRALTDAEITSIFNAGIAGKLKQNRAIDTNSLVSVWQGEGNANDARGANNGTFSANTYAAGKVGQAFSLDGIDDSVNFGSLPPMQNFSFEAWVNPSSAVNDPTNQELIVGQASFGGQMVVRPGTNGGMRVVIQYRDTPTSFAQLTSNIDIPLNSWTHLNANYDGTTLKIYINGVLNAQSNPTNTTVQTCNTPYFIGGFQSVTDCNGITNQPFQFFNGLIDEAAVYNRALTAAEVRANYEAGNALSTVVGDARITFPTVTTAGTTQQIPLDKNLFPALTVGTHTGLFYDIGTSAAFMGNPTVCFNLPSFSAMQFSNLRVMHFENNNWVDVTASAGNTFPTLCTTPVSSFSPFAIVAVNAPTAAEVSVSGRVLARRRGVARARVSMTDGQGNVRTVTTNSFGYYRFANVPAGETYIFSVSHKQYRFQNNPIVLSVDEDLNGFNFTASP